MRLGISQQLHPLPIELCDNAAWVRRAHSQAARIETTTKVLL
jgi:hypothetical protein